MGWGHRRISILPRKVFVKENMTLLPDHDALYGQKLRNIASRHNRWHSKPVYYVNPDPHTHLSFPRYGTATFVKNRVSSTSSGAYSPLQNRRGFVGCLATTFKPGSFWNREERTLLQEVVITSIIYISEAACSAFAARFHQFLTGVTVVTLPSFQKQCSPPLSWIDGHKLISTVVC